MAGLRPGVRDLERGPLARPRRRTGRRRPLPVVRSRWPVGPAVSPPAPGIRGGCRARGRPQDAGGAMGPLRATLVGRARTSQSRCSSGPTTTRRRPTSAGCATCWARSRRTPRCGSPASTSSSRARRPNRRWCRRCAASCAGLRLHLGPPGSARHPGATQAAPRRVGAVARAGRGAPRRAGGGGGPADGARSARPRVANAAPITVPRLDRRLHLGPGGAPGRGPDRGRGHHGAGNRARRARSPGGQRSGPGPRRPG